ncbi:MAG: Asp-tRNA(Asn)/Glu-tRNA(Gln) amidotransferase GatCAB subunit B [Candidatus Lloydbacteria bacterium CG22_combo_CG10-13_8_21_14_all_47_15]|uniref:Aspartyl/glutamyl-tRNA(Asn/Gln) amidotransferase subunit B n=1 Tax=Candidatus Lloydbacteria bacterium CG22_combo_CG10-13_8_21_14_all_47_15 TaxID=1974635 RepID=A0A2H0CWB8_9BACT|nr:MAG: Asp-tRNA(Asn)/Glu-tRNA(Gln) amidotransferase GatCAB subunit B [Candidatus Lloydbacteria bacterium CG22_combo_CG10-13_8_21_14_all_47_15]
MADYTPTIGLEVHAELKTRTKMFCDSKNDPDETRPNVNVCPVCMGHPGTLPTINKEAVGHIIKIGKAVGGRIADETHFDRKNYFYPDIPKGYQISQYKDPIISGGVLHGVLLTRIHLEEDTARSIHDAETDGSLVDFNRAGIPLMELVTEPVIENAKQAVDFARELQLLLKTLGISEANMEKGEMRVEANISVAPRGGRGTKVEVKNLNSFRSVERAIEYEIIRQIEVLEAGGSVTQETRGWDEGRQETFSQRLKETSEDYRYFPEPDLPPLKLSLVSDWHDIVLPELPWIRRERYQSQFGLRSETAETLVYNELLREFFDDVLTHLPDNKTFATLSANYITSDIAGFTAVTGRGIEHIAPRQFAALIGMIGGGDISSRGAKDILAVMFEKGGEPRAIALEKGLLQESDEGALKNIALKIIADNRSVADEYIAGKEAAIQFLIGQGMKATKGAANPGVLKNLFESLLK